MWKANFIASIAATTLKSYLQPSTIDSGAGSADAFLRLARHHILGG